MAARWLLHALDGELDREHARAAGDSAGERLAHIDDQREVVGDARLDAGRQPVDVRLLRGVDDEMFSGQRCHEPLDWREKYLGVPGEVLRLRLRQRAVAGGPLREVVLG